MKNTLKIEGLEKETTSINIDENVTAIGKLSASLIKMEHIDGFSDFQVLREGEEIFDGRIEQPQPQFSIGGSTQKIIGYDYTVLLKDYLTPSTSVVDSTTNTTITTLLTNTPFTLSLESTFVYLDNSFIYDTSLEFLTIIPTYVDTCIEYDPSELEIDDEFRVGSIDDFGQGYQHISFFFDGKPYGGSKEWFYIFTRESGFVYYYFSEDGTTWTRTNTTISTPNLSFTATLNGGKVYLMIFDSFGPGMDIYRGTINIGTGAIGFAMIANNVTGNLRSYGPVFDDSDHLWIVEDDATGTVWESTDDGVTWNNRFTGAANHHIHGVLPTGSDGDLYTFVVDILNNDMEEWFYDRSAGTHTFVRKITNTTGDIDVIDGAINANFRPSILWLDLAKTTTATLVAGVWVVVQITTTGTFANIACDGGDCCYVICNSAAGTFINKYRDGVLESSTDYSAKLWGQSGLMVGCSRAYTSDGNLGIFFHGLDIGNDGWFILTDPSGLKLNDGAVTGSVTTDTVTASVNMSRWGWVTSSGDLVADDVLWSILKDVDDSILLEDEITPFDMAVEGLSATETTIKIKADLTDSGDGSPLIATFDYSEYLDSLTMDFDYEDCYTAMEKWRAISNGEFWITEDDGVFTIHVALTRGEDKSNLIVLKNAKSAEYPNVKPNIKVVDYTQDWSDYANSIMMIGSGSGVTRIEEYGKNQDGIDTYDTHAITIRNQDIQTIAMARTLLSIELAIRESYVRRVTAEILDNYDSNVISIGDTVTVSIVFEEDENVNLKTTMRIIALNRDYSESGERVTVELSNQNKAVLFYSYLLKTINLERWVTT